MDPLIGFQINEVIRKAMTSNPAFKIAVRFLKKMVHVNSIGFVTLMMY